MGNSGSTPMPRGPPLIPVLRASPMPPAAAVHQEQTNGSAPASAQQPVRPSSSTSPNGASSSAPAAAAPPKASSPRGTTPPRRKTRDKDARDAHPPEWLVGRRVRRSASWRWGDQDGAGVGTVSSVTDDAGWAAVSWDCGQRNRYRFGHRRFYDIYPLPALPEEKPEAAAMVGRRVRRGPDWVHGAEDGMGIGTVRSAPDATTVDVLWDTGQHGTYRWGEGVYELAPGAEIEIPPEEVVGRRVARGQSWKWGDQDGNTIGVATGTVGRGRSWLTVVWDSGSQNRYRWGAEASYDLRIVPEAGPGNLPAQQIIGSRVRRGPAWEWGEQDAGNGLGRILGPASIVGWVNVRWDNGRENRYRWGLRGQFDLTAVLESGSAAPRAVDIVGQRVHKPNSGDQGLGNVVSANDCGCHVVVHWDDGTDTTCSWGAHGVYDVELEHPPGDGDGTTPMPAIESTPAAPQGVPLGTMSEQERESLTTAFLSMAQADLGLSGDLLIVAQETIGVMCESGFFPTYEDFVQRIVWLTRRTQTPPPTTSPDTSRQRTQQHQGSEPRHQHTSREKQQQHFTQEQIAEVVQSVAAMGFPSQTAAQVVNMLIAEKKTMPSPEEVIDIVVTLMTSAQKDKKDGKEQESKDAEKKDAPPQAAQNPIGNPADALWKKICSSVSIHVPGFPCVQAGGLFPKELLIASLADRRAAFIEMKKIQFPEKGTLNKLLKSTKIYYDSTRPISSVVKAVTKGNGEFLRGNVTVQWDKEVSVDVGGVSKALLQDFARHSATQHFLRSSGKNAAMYISYEALEDPDALVFFHAVGRLAGFALFNNEGGFVLPLRLATAFFKVVLGRPIDADDLEEIDPYLYRGLKQLCEYQDSIEDSDLYFSVTRFDRAFPLKPNGGDIQVTKENFAEYCSLCIGYRLGSHQHARKMLQQFARGMTEVVPQQLLELMTPKDLQLLVCGDSRVHRRDLLANLRWRSACAEKRTAHRTRDWLARLIESTLTDDELSLFFKFITGSEAVPAGGCSSLTIVVDLKDVGPQYRPVAHTCFNTIDLPINYRSKEELLERLREAMQTEGFQLR